MSKQLRITVLADDAVAGGFHLLRAAHPQLEANGSALAARCIQVFAPCHCTGMGAHSYLRVRFQPRVRDMGVGARLDFGES